MDRFIGIDVHAQSCTVAVMGAKGRRLREQRVETHAETLLDFLRSIAGRRHICMEEGTYSEWLFELLEPLSERLLVVHPARRGQGSKNDAIDAWRLANDLRTGVFKDPVFKAPQQFTSLRQAVRGHRAVVQDVVRTKNRLRALYRSRGVRVDGGAPYRAQERQRYLDQLPPQQRSLAELWSQELDALLETRRHAEQWLRQECKRAPIVKRIATAPGIGTIRAAQIVATVITPHRFRTKRQFWSYCGLAVVTSVSSEWCKDERGGWLRQKVPQPRGLNNNRQPLLKCAFKGAAMTVITSPRQSELRTAYQHLLEAGTKPNLARLTIARRIAATVLAMWKNQEDYDPNKRQSNTRR